MATTADDAVSPTTSRADVRRPCSYGGCWSFAVTTELVRFGAADNRVPVCAQHAARLRAALPR